MKFSRSFLVVLFIVAASLICYALVPSGTYRLMGNGGAGGTTINVHVNPEIGGVSTVTITGSILGSTINSVTYTEPNNEVGPDGGSVVFWVVTADGNGYSVTINIVPDDIKKPGKRKKKEVGGVFDNAGDEVEVLSHTGESNPARGQD